MWPLLSPNCSEKDVFFSTLLEENLLLFFGTLRLGACEKKRKS